MKRFLKCAFVCMLLLTSCKGKTANIKTYSDKAVSLTMEKTDECYFDVVSGVSALKELEQYKKLCQTDYTDAKVYAITIDEDKMHSYMERMGLDFEEMSDDLKKNTMDASYRTIFQRLVFSEGSEVGALSSILSTTLTFNAGKPTDNEILLYCKEDSYPMAVILTFQEDGSATASTMPLFIKDIPSNADEIETLFEEMPAIDVNVEEYTNS